MGGGSGRAARGAKKTDAVTVELMGQWQRAGAARSIMYYLLCNTLYQKKVLVSSFFFNFHTFFALSTLLGEKLMRLSCIFGCFACISPQILIE